ncbi:hypothetical protein BU26DRAFT_517013 [Trematosphaeria pertusa]|uniref:F-box domain-containing protein n=1 Tax=Trematosphaeria pertusa TaxID=390896 RepID=A0A6A6IP87_9PLEO|nr:uncharacterized protein BU26DRAFT_517013 [Trematosphaeria pertusa]KAF2252374.1 hypothetical protein BU26DRAFT_517013 [Trematosphaeria pertusa]
MPTNFLSLPSEVRNDIYEQLLVLQTPVACPTHPWLGRSQVRVLTPGLLLANKAVHSEASSLLYAQNRFDFTLCTPEHVASFLEQIGRNNADYIRHIRIDFPDFGYLEPNDVTFEDDSLRILAKIQSDCANLSTLTTSLSSTYAMELRLDALDNFRVVGEALKLVNTRFRAISSLQEIIVEVYEDGPSDHMRREMKSHGWTISTTEYVEESGFDESFSDLEDYYSGYDDDGGDCDDDYDIDNDSDFWRRAGD